MSCLTAVDLEFRSCCPEPLLEVMMTLLPFVSLPTVDAQPANLRVPQGHTGFALGQEGRKRLECGTHDIQPLTPSTIFLIRVGASHDLQLESLGNSMLRDDTGVWRPLRVIGFLEYSVLHAERFMDALERDSILETHDLEKELTRIVLERVNRFLECDTWRQETLAASLECASGELLIHVEEALDPLGIQVQTFELSADLTGDISMSHRGMS
jgi:hypothetical protein